MSSWKLQPILDSYLLVGAIAAALCLLLLIAPRFAALTPRRRWTLVALRLLVVSMVVAAMLRPTHISTRSEPQSAVLLVLLDESRSMLLPNQSGSDSRWQAQAAALAQANEALANLPERMSVKFYSYATELREIERRGDSLALPDEPTGDQTDIGTALSEAVRRELGKRVAGVILMGDGTQTAFAPPVEIQQAGRELQRLGYPLYTVAFGPAGDAVQARDVAIEGLQDQYTVFVKNELPVRAAVRIRGYANRQIPVEMIVQRPDAQTETIGPVSVAAQEDGQLVEAAFNYAPQQAGRYKLTVRAAAQPGELVTKNNELTAFLRVLEGGLNVLYLEGELRTEQVFLRRSIAASPDIQLDFRWIDPRRRDRWPLDLVEELAAQQYDAMIIGDLDSAALNEATWKRIAESVEAGTGLAMIGGFHSFGAGGYRDTPLADVLPIEMDRFERQDFDSPVRADLHLQGPLQLVPTTAHPITRLGSSENHSLWQRLPPLTGANRFVGVKEAVGVRVLAESPDGAPLLVAGVYGNGRVAAFAGDSTWRWAMRGQQSAHKRFWRQMVLWLAQREESEQDEVWVQLDQRRLNPGATAVFTTGVRAATGETLSDAQLQAEVILPDGSRQSVRLSRTADHWIGQFDTTKLPGDYAIEVHASREQKPLGTGRGEFLVFDQDIELAAAAADHDQLARLAAMTREFGGRQVAPEQLAMLINEIAQRPPEMEVEIQTKWQLAGTARDAWLFFLIFTGLLAAEWALRKKWGLV